MKEKNKEISARIAEIIEKTGNTPNSFAKELGYTRAQTIYDILNGKSAPSYDFFNRFANTEYSVKVNIQWLLTGNGEMMKEQDPRADERPGLASYRVADDDEGGLPLIPMDAVAGFPSIDVNGVSFADCERYRIPEFEARGAQFIIRVSGHSMMPTYQNGDLLGCRKIERVSFFQWGEVYVLDTCQGPLVKRVFPVKDEPDTIQCVSDNTNFPPFTLPGDEIRSLSTIVGLIRLS